MRWCLPNTQVAAQAPRVPTWFFFDGNNSFLKFINDDDNNDNNSSNFLFYLSNQINGCLLILRIMFF
jgi:hypothetical protein